MIQLKNEQQIEGIAASAEILKATFSVVEKTIRTGMTTAELDKIVYNTITEAGARPAFLNYMGFPASACISINEEVIHGIPGPRIIKEGDLVSVDIGVDLGGFISDRAYTFAVGKISTREQELLTVTQAALQAGIEAAVPGNRIKDISRAIYEAASEYGVVYEYCGHGVGLSVHEEPSIPNVVGVRGKNPRIKAGMVLALEPMINLGTADVDLLSDEWTVVTADGLKSAHFEHTVAVTADGNRVLT